MGITNFKVYTPYEYASFIIKLALKNYFKKEYTKKKLDNLRAADLSCGTGNLLLILIEELIILSKKITGEYYFNSDWVNGYDIDSSAFAEYIKSGKKILKKYNLTGEISGFVTDSLTADIPKGKYNIILGNPPYIGEKNHQQLFLEMKKTKFGRKYYEGKMDYFYYFIEKGADILNENGIMIYVTTNYWLKADSAVILREKLKNDGVYTHIVDYNISIFKDAPGQHNLIFSWIKGEISKDKSIFIQKEQKRFKLNNNEIYDETGNIILVSRENIKFNKKILKKSNYKLKDIVNINQGIVSGCDKAFVITEFKEEFKDYLKPFYKNKDIFKYNCKKENDFWIYYIDKNTEISERLKEEFSPYIDTLLKRREVKSGHHKWWTLSWARDKNIMTGEKILARQRCKTNYFAYDNGEFFGSADIYYLTLKDNLFKKFNIFYILGYLNSTIFYKWYKNNGKCKGYNLEFYTTPLKEVPLYYPEDTEEINHIETLVKQQTENYSEEIQEQINNYFEKTFFEC